MPESAEADVRLFWAPARVSVCFLHNGVRNKISLRPHLHRSAVWRAVEYQHSVFDDDTRRALPLMFYIPSEIPIGRNQAPQSRNPTTDARKSDQRNSRATYPSNSNDWADVRDWPDWRAAGRGHYSGEDWKVWRQQSEEKKWRKRRIGIEKSRMVLCATGNSQKSFPPNAPRGVSPKPTPKSPAIAPTPTSRPRPPVKRVTPSHFKISQNPRPPRLWTPNLFELSRMAPFRSSLDQRKHLNQNPLLKAPNP